MNATHSIITLIIAGAAFFLFGMGLVSEHLQKLASNRIRDIISKLGNKPILGFGAGILITVLIQSSGAVTSMLVGLGSAGVITLQQVMGIILGTGVGTTVTTQLLSFNISQFGLPIFAVCFLVQFLTSKPLVNRWMGVGMGLGLMFWGLELVGMGTHALKDNQLFISALEYLRQNPFILVMITAFLTAIFASSAAVVGIAMSLAGAGLITVQDAFFWVYGANIGTTATALMASAGGNYVGRQIAWAHCFHKIVMVGLFYFITPWVADWIQTGSPIRDVANAHLVFNFVGAILFFPFIKQGAALVERFVKPGAGEKDFSVKFLDRVNFESPAVCIAHAEREILRMGDIVTSMIRDSLNVFRNENLDLVTDLRNRDNKVDLLNREISLFVTKYMDQADGATHSQMVRLFSVASDLESAADVIDNSMLELAAKKHSLKVEFSAQGWHDLENMHKAVIEVAELSLSCFQTQNKDLASQVVFKKRVIRKMEKQMRESHIERLVKGLRETINTSSIHMDMLSDYRRVVGLLSNHVYGALRESDKYNIMPRREE
jgi:phosphate:Na+ symporter